MATFVTSRHALEVPLRPSSMDPVGFGLLPASGEAPAGSGIGGRVRQAASARRAGTAGHDDIGQRDRAGGDADGGRSRSLGTGAKVGIDTPEADGNLACPCSSCSHSAARRVEAIGPRRNPGEDP